MVKIHYVNMFIMNLKTIRFPHLCIHRAAVVAVLWVLAFSLGCSSDIEESPVGTSGADIVSSKNVPARVGENVSTSSRVTIGPPEPVKSSRISLKADNSVLYGGNVYWYVNGQPVGQGGTRLSYRDIFRGDVIKAVIVKDDGEEISSNELVIKNSPPSIHRSDMLPQFPMAGHAPKVEVWGNDADGDKVSFEYQWYVNNKPRGRWNVLEAEFTKRDKIKVEVTPYDGLDYGRTITLRPMVANAPPIITEDRGTYEGGVYKNQIIASDPDNDTLVFKLIEAPEGMKIDSSSGLITWPVVLESEKSYTIEVRVSDGDGGSSVYSFELTTLLEKPSGQ